MFFSTLSIAALSLFGCALAAPTAQKRDAPGPSGQLQFPQGNAVWDNTGGFGLGHVVYQGVDQPYHNSQGVIHVKTHHIDISLQLEADSNDVVYLAKGLAPNSNNVVDVQFQIPIGYGGPTGEYYLVIEETQAGTLPEGGPIPITFRSAAPLIQVTAGPTAAQKAKRDAPGPSGTLQLPQGNAVWDNTGNFGLGHVVYQGVDQDYTNSQGVTHVKTHHIDISLQLEADSNDVVYLAKGLAPNSNNVVDVEFQIPIAYGGPTGEYYLVIEETQEGTTPGSPIPITFRSAAPLIQVTAGPN
ncbi:hypothetical protein CALVIDRAFT_566010 [Calocera viscosa TUFC12733]|uniref:Uncharacterized protein n=1 Tax=Calocera viscosa (strain TUFC12733) TaxID=1330018 RepID=A0A167JXS0_CALVF|nr:hypothetical protein CALVIDRAFT_566010 [Calocera viscosa TUFC12733]